MHLVELLVRTIAAAIILTAPLASQPADAQGGAGADNAACLGCHGTPGFAAPGADGRERPLFVPADQFGQSVHAALPCVTCHAGTAEMPHKIAPASAAERRRQNPEFCGGCHADALADYRASVHGRGLALGDAAAAVCSDCHGTHTVARPQSAASRLAVAQACGNCHTDAAQSFRETYHGQILALGRADTATCADCHRGHAILPSGERASSVSAPNILAVCRNCHQDAAPGFATFHAHATTDDFTRYPLEWLAAKFLLALTVSVFGLLWPHSALWFYREFRDRQQRKPRPHVRAEALPPPDTRHYLRWSATYRWAHLVFAVSFIVLALTGLPLAYPTAGWAPGLMRALGGVAVAGLVHRVAAVVMTAVFAAQVVYAVLHVARNWKAFKIFGPYSLIPNLQDAKDVWAMLKWFVGKGPRPVFDHWNYLQKVDYWGPFWGIAILATTGVLLWFTALTATYLPGWVFNVATVTHREDALFATLYLFTIHYFVNHWRPDKFPLDLVMFTGSMPLEEFKREYAVGYARLAETGELKKYLVDAPSRPMTLGSTILGFALVGIGLAVLVLIVIGIGANG